MADNKINIVIGADIEKLKKGFQDAVKITGASGEKISTAMEATAKQIEQDFDRISKSANTKRAVTQLQNLALKVQSLGPEFQDMANKIIRSAGEIKDSVGDVGAQINYFSSDTRRLDAVVSGVQGVAGAFAVAEGAAALLGSENQDLQKTMQKVQGAIALLNGLQAVQNVLQQESAAFTGLNALAQRALALQSYATASAMNAFKVALAATGVGIAIVGFTMLASKMSENAAKAREVAASQKKYREELEKNVAEAKSQELTILSYLKIAKDTTRTENERAAAMKKLTELGVETSDLNVKNAGTLAVLQQRTNDYIEVLKTKAIAESYSNEVSDKAKKYADAQAISVGLVAVATKNLNAALANNFNVTKAQENLNKTRESTSKNVAKAEQALNDVLNRQQTAIESLNKAQGKVNTTEDEVKAELKARENAIKTQEELDKKDLERMKKQIEKMTALQFAARGGNIPTPKPIAPIDYNPMQYAPDEMVNGELVPGKELGRKFADYQVQQQDDLNKRMQQKWFEMANYYRTAQGKMQLLAQNALQKKLEADTKYIEANKVFVDSFNQTFKGIQMDALVGLGESVGNALANGANLLDSIFSVILNSVASFAEAYGKALIAAAIASEAFQKLLIANPVLAIAAGVALVATATVVRSVADQGVTAFANGGIVSGPTLGLMGEYPGASSNPEVIAPLDKLKSMLGGSGDSSGYIAETRFDGRDLFLAVRKYERDSKRG